jgi:polar amino acid transport system permease protein
MVEFSFAQILANLLLAARWTVLLALMAFVSGGLVGLLVLLGRVSPLRWLRWLTGGYIELLQGTPLLMQLFLLFFGLPLVGIGMTPFLAAMLGLTLWTAAFLAEIWRGCVAAIPRGQWEAGRALALTYPQQMRLLILPQAVKLAIPPTVGFSLQVVKGTALTAIIGFVELAKAGTMITNATFKPFLVYGLVALIYFALCYPLSRAARSLERRMRGA